MRAEKNIRLATLAQRIGVSRQIVYEWESGSKSPDRDKVFILAEILGQEVLQRFSREALAKQGMLDESAPGPEAA